MQIVKIFGPHQHHENQTLTIRQKNADMESIICCYSMGTKFLSFCKIIFIFFLHFFISVMGHYIFLFIFISRFCNFLQLFFTETLCQCLAYDQNLALCLPAVNTRSKSLVTPILSFLLLPTFHVLSKQDQLSVNEKMLPRALVFLWNGNIIQA